MLVATRAPKRVLLADNHVVVRELVKRALEAYGFDVVGEARSGIEAVHLCCQLHPDVVVLEISMAWQDQYKSLLRSTMNGIQAASEIKKLRPETHVIVLTLRAEPAYVAECVRAGVNGYVLKTSMNHALKDAIFAAAEGAFVLGPGVIRK